MPEYVYGIVEATAAAPTANGVTGAPVRVIGGDRAAVLVSDLPSGELRLSREDMMAHARVLEGALAEGTVLPMRFGIVMDPDEVQARLLQAHGDDLRAQLERLAGKVEMSVRVLYEQEPLMRELVNSDRRIAALRE